jgi:hypothetical protein
MPVQTVFENLQAGMSLDEITEVFDVTPEEVKAVLRFATESLTKTPTFGWWKSSSITGLRSQLRVVSPTTKSVLRAESDGTNWGMVNWFKRLRKPDTASSSAPIRTSATNRTSQAVKIALVVLGNQQWPLVKRHLDKIAAAVDACTPGSYTEVEIPFE